MNISCTVGNLLVMCPNECETSDRRERRVSKMFFDKTLYYDHEKIIGKAQGIADCKKLSASWTLYCCFRSRGSWTLYYKPDLKIECLR